MPPLVVPNAVQLSARGTILGKPWANVVGVRFGPDGTGGGVFIDQALASALGGALRAAYAGAAGSLVDEWILQEVLVFDLQSATAPSWDAGIATLAGSNTGDPMPSNMAACVTHRTAYRGKSYRGRTYICGLPESGNDAAGHIATGTRGTLESMFTTFRTQLAAIATVSARHAVISRALSSAFEVVSSQCDEDWDHQDRRKR